MTALAANTGGRLYDCGVPPYLEEFEMLTATTIFQGSACCVLAAGYARPVAASLTAPEFIGFAESYSTNPGASGAVRVLVRQKGILSVPAAQISGATIANIGDSLYMSDDGSGFDLVSTNNVLIGKIVSFSDGFFSVHFEGAPVRSL